MDPVPASAYYEEVYIFKNQKYISFVFQYNDKQYIAYHDIRLGIHKLINLPDNYKTDNPEVTEYVYVIPYESRDDMILLDDIKCELKIMDTTIDLKFTEGDQKLSSINEYNVKIMTKVEIFNNNKAIIGKILQYINNEYNNAIKSKCTSGNVLGYITIPSQNLVKDMYESKTYRSFQPPQIIMINYDEYVPDYQIPGTSLKELQEQINDLFEKSPLFYRLSILLCLEESGIACYGSVDQVGAYLLVRLGVNPKMLTDALRCPSRALMDSINVYRVAFAIMSKQDEHSIIATCHLNASLYLLTICLEEECNSNSYNNYVTGILADYNVIFRTLGPPSAYTILSWFKPIRVKYSNWFKDNNSNNNDKKETKDKLKAITTSNTQVSQFSPN